MVFLRYCVHKPEFILYTAYMASEIGDGLSGCFSFAKLGQLGTACNLAGHFKWPQIHCHGAPILS